jgi:hypothetical protein
MTRDEEEIDARLKRINERLASLRALSAEMREEIIVATDQLLDHALRDHRNALEASRTERARRKRHTPAP